ncbi:MAG: non-canonical purine NTP diphosphatase [Flavobacteriales bacterium]|jgi:XTP/dITP diphosphohydrolase
MRELVFASGNENKVKEVESKLGGTIHLKSLNAIGCLEDIPETGSTLEANARIKARYVWEKYGMNCFADDTGLEVEALGGRPGVLSARYAGEQKNANDNMTLLLQELSESDNRKARFRTAICLIMNGEEHMFEGIVDGEIIRERKGEEGFGYDPVFVPLGFDRTFAQMTIEEKNKMSHRGRALQALSSFLNTH